MIKEDRKDMITNNGYIKINGVETLISEIKTTENFVRIILPINPNIIDGIRANEPIECYVVIKYPIKSDDMRVYEEPRLISTVHDSFVDVDNSMKQACYSSSRLYTAETEIEESD